MLREISTENLMDLLKPKTHVYCKVSNLKVGDYVDGLLKIQKFYQ